MTHWLFILYCTNQLYWCKHNALKQASREKHAALTYICEDFLYDQGIYALHLGCCAQQAALQVRQVQPLPAEQPLLQPGVAVRVGVSKLIHLPGPTWKRPDGQSLLLEEGFAAV